MDASDWMRPFFCKRPVLSPVGEALAAIDRTVVAGLKGDFAFLAAFGAHSVEHLAAASFTAGSLAGGAAGLAALGFVLETLFSVECLFVGGEDKFSATVFADESFVVVHGIPL